MRRVFWLMTASVALVLLVPLAAAFPEAQSPLQHQWQSLFMTVFWAALVIGVLVEGLLVYTLIRFRRRPHGPKEGPQIHGNHRVEILWTIAPAVVMGWLLVVSWNGLTLTDNAPPADFYVDVTASQFSWAFKYPDGTKSNNGTLRVEEGKVVVLNVTSTDVIHAFSVPQLGVMIDAIPGRYTHAWFQAESPGVYHAMCRELCNNEYRAGHGRMTAKVHVFAAGEQEDSWGWPAVAGPAPPGGGGNVTGNETAQAVKLSPGGNFKLEPVEFVLEKGEAVAFAVKNDDPRALHNFFIGLYDEGQPDHGARWKSSDLEAGANETFAVPFPDEDVTFEMWCDVPGHRQAGMTGTITLGAGKALEAEKKPLLPGPQPAFVLLGIALVVLGLRRRQ